MSEVKKIVVIGSESTGKSTLSAALAETLHTVWVPEYARQYLEELGRKYRQSDLLEIAKGQLALEDKLAQQANGLLICDTDLHVIKVWSEAAYGNCNKWILEQIAARTYDMYILTYIDTVWEEDALREHAAPEERLYFYSLYYDIVQNTGLPVVIVKGSPAERLKIALDSIKQHIIS